MTADRRTGGPADRMRRAGLVVAAVAGLLSAGPPVRLSAQQDASAIVDRAVAAFQEVTTLRADFTQTVRDEMIGTNSTSRGEFMQQRPNRFSMRWRQPAGDVILSDGRWLWVYLPSTTPNQVVKSQVSNLPGQSPDVVAEFLSRPQERFTISYARAEPVSRRDADVVSFVPKQPGGPYRRVLLWIDRQDNLPHQVEITEASGAIRRVTLDRLRINGALPSSAFVFRPPAGARIVDASR